MNRFLRTKGRRDDGKEEIQARRRAGGACFVMAASALGRTVFTLCQEGFPALASYTTFLVPLFAMAGLLCLVFSALFRQAAELKAENDLTI